MKTFTLTIDIQDNSIRDTVYVAQMLREAAMTLEYPVPLAASRRVNGPTGAAKFSWVVSGTLMRDEKSRRAGGRQ